MFDFNLDEMKAVYRFEEDKTPSDLELELELEALVQELLA